MIETREYYNAPRPRDYEREWELNLPLLISYIPPGVRKYVVERYGNEDWYPGTLVKGLPHNPGIKKVYL